MSNTYKTTPAIKREHLVPDEKALVVPIFQGKVRNIYQPTGLIFEVSDRLSVFDRVICEKVPSKGNMLNCISQENKKRLESLGYVTDYLPVSEEFFKLLGFKNVGKLSYSKELLMIPLEIIVRGYLTGSAYKAYKKGESYCGYTFSDGMKDGDKLQEPIVTPTTKESTGHDKPVTKEEAIEIIALWMLDNELSYVEDDFKEMYDSLEEAMNSYEFSEKAKVFAESYEDEWKKLEIMYAYDDAEGTLNQIYDIALLAFTELTETYEKNDILFIDTKFEFGFDESREITLADEVGTPDSSRLAPKSVYENEGKIISLDKQIVRDYCKSKGFNGDESQKTPDVPNEIWKKVTDTYVNVATKLFGEEIVNKYL